jgi:hypothetical protein
VDVATNFVLKWDPFAGGTTNDSITFSLADSNGTVVFRSATFGLEAGRTLLDAMNTSILIPSNSLAWGQTYYGYLIFEKDRLVQTTNYAGARGLAGFAKATSFTLKTRPMTPPWLEVLGVKNSAFTMRLHGDAGRSYVVLSATNIIGSDWKPLATNTAISGAFNFTNALGTDRWRFFRAVLSP